MGDIYSPISTFVFTGTTLCIVCAEPIKRGEIVHLVRRHRGVLHEDDEQIGYIHERCYP